MGVVWSSKIRAGERYKARYFEQTFSVQNYRAYSHSTFNPRGGVFFAGEKDR